MKNATISSIPPSTLYPLEFADRPLYEVREDKGFYVPDLLTDTEYEASAEAYAAFEQQAKHLRTVEGLIGDAWNLVGLMLAAMGDHADSRAVQTEAGLEAIEKKLRKAYAKIDRHDTRYANLFFAYFDLKDKTKGGTE